MTTAVDDLVSRAADIRTELGRIPSQRELRTRLSIGHPKAKAVLTELAARDHQDRDTEPPATTLEPVTEHPVTPVTSPEPPAEPVARPVAKSEPAVTRKRPRTWPLVFLSLPAFVAIWSGWVGLGQMAGFGVVHPLPGIVDDLALNSAITLPIGVETYAAYALYVWLSGGVTGHALRFARWSAVARLATGALGQVAYHVLTAAGVGIAPWWITALVACLPVDVLGMGASLAHLVTTQNHPHDHP